MENNLTNASIRSAASVLRVLADEPGISGERHGRLLGMACWLDSLEPEPDAEPTVIPIPQEALTAEAGAQLVEFYEPEARGE